MSVASEFLQVCDEQKNNKNPVASAFVNVVDRRTAHYPSAWYPVLEPTLLTRDVIKNSFKGNPSTLTSAFLNQTNQSRFETFLRELYKRIRNVQTTKYEHCDPQLVKEEYDEVEYVTYHAYVVIACMCYFVGTKSKPQNKDWASIREFVTNVATRAYRVPRTARYLTAVFLKMENSPIEDGDLVKEGYVHLLRSVKKCCSLD